MPPPNRNAEYRAVRGLSRGLRLLLSLNECPNGRATCSELGTRTGLHRTTVRRMLETLAEDGYVRRSSDDTFALTAKVKQLSDGCTNSDRLSALAAPVMGELLKSLVWPSDLAAPDGGELRICESTRRFSPLSFHGSLEGRSLPYLLTAAGRAYFGYCSDKEREQILELLRLKDDAEGCLARDDRAIANLVRAVRAEGMGTNIGEWAPEKKVGAIAMPIFSGESVLGALNVVYLVQAITLEQAIAKFGPPLRAASERISAMLSETAPAPP